MTGRTTPGVQGVGYPLIPALHLGGATVLVVLFIYDTSDHLAGTRDRYASARRFFLRSETRTEDCLRPPH